MDLRFKRVGHAAQFFANAVRNIYRPPLVVLGYHRVTTLKSDPFGLAISPTIFLEQMKWLSKKFEMIAASELGTAGKRRRILITFDDGYIDNMKNALPILRALKIPALLFVVTAAVGKKKEFFWDSLSRTFLTDKEHVRNFYFRGKTLALDSKAEKIEALERVWADIRRMPAVARDKAVSKVSRKLGVSPVMPQACGAMSLHQLKAWAATPGMAIGGHTRTHSLLPGDSLRGQRNEISGCFQDLERWGIESACFAYPYGEYDNTSLRVVQESGCRFAFTTRVGAVRNATSPWELPRLFVEAWSPKDFSKNVQRAFLRS